MKDVRDVTSTVFGLFIAYLLPGLTAFYALSFWSSPVEDWFERIVNGDASGGLIMFIIFGAIMIALTATDRSVPHIRAYYLPQVPLRSEGIISDF
jgi:hypothetical protein